MAGQETVLPADRGHAEGGKKGWLDAIIHVNIGVSTYLAN